MTACIVWRCTRPGQTGLCERHGGPARDVRGPSDAHADRWATLLDDEQMAEDVRAHNAALASNVLLDALR